MGLGRVIPRAAPTVAAVGQEGDADVTVGLETGDAVAVGVEATADGDETPEPPQAVKTTSAARIVIRREVSGDTYNVSFASCRLSGDFALPIVRALTRRLTLGMLHGRP
jgi:hypothetical protein